MAMPNGKNTSATMKELKASAVKHGWLIKEGGNAKNYKVRYIVVVQGELHYYEKENSPEANGTLSLAGATCVYEGAKKNGKRSYNTFTVNIKDVNKKKKKDNHGGIYRFMADGKELAEAWVASINEAKK